MLQLLITARDAASDVLGRIRQSIGGIGDIAATVARAGLAALVAGIAALGAAFAYGLRNAAEFETIMARIQASGVSSAAELKKVADAAKEMGVSTGAGAAQAAVGLEGLIKAGLSTSEAIGTLPNILALASGQMLAMDEATTLVIKTVNQFGLSFKDSKTVVDTLATGANVAATSVQELAQGLENSGLEARKAGLSLQETVAALNTLMQNGQDAAGAGEALQSMLLELSDVSGPAREALRSVGVATGDFQTILALLAQGGPEASAVMAAFGETALTAAGILGNALPFYQEQVKQIKAVGVSAQEASDIMGKTFNSQVQTLNTTWQEFWQTLAEPTLPALTESLKTLTTFITDNRQALSDWVTLGFAPVTASIDGVRLGIAAWNGDTEKANQIQTQMNERLTAIQRALTGTSAEYSKAKAATEGQKAATEDAAQATEQQTAALRALQDAIREHTQRAKEAAAGSELQAFHTEQARIAQAQYDAELKKGLPTAQQHATAQQAVGKSLSELHVAYQVAAAMVERLTEQNQKGLATDQQVTEAKLAKKRAEDEYTSAAKLGAEAAEKSLTILQAEAPTIEAVSGAKLAQQQAILKLAQARGDDQKVAEAQLEITKLEVQQEIDLATNKTLQARETALLLNAKKAEYALTIQSNAGQQEEVRLLEETVKQKLAESGAAWEAVRAREKEIQQAEIMAGPVGQLTRLYAEQTQEHQRAADASERYYDTQLQEIDGSIRVAQARGDEAEVSKLQAEQQQLLIDQAQQIAANRAQEALDAQKAVEAKTLELAADGELSKADQQQIADLQAVADQKKDAAEQARNHASGLQAEADAARELPTAWEDGAQRAKRMAEESKTAIQESAAQAKAAGGIVSGFYNSAISVMSSLSQGAVAEFKKLRGEVVPVGNELDVVRQRVEQTEQALGRMGTAGGSRFIAFLGQITRDAVTVQKSFLDQASAAERLVEQLNAIGEGGQASGGALDYLIRQAKDSLTELNLLDDQRLDQLASAIDSANAKLRQMQEETQSARDRLTELNAEILEAQGQDQKAELLRQQLDYQQNLAEIEKQRQDAELMGNRELLALLDQQQSKLEELNRIKVENINNENNVTTQTTTRTTQLANEAERAANALRAVSSVDLTPISTQAERLSKSFSDLNGVL